MLLQKGVYFHPRLETQHLPNRGFRKQFRTLSLLTQAPQERLERDLSLQKPLDGQIRREYGGVFAHFENNTYKRRTFRPFPLECDIRPCLVLGLQVVDWNVEGRFLTLTPVAAPFVSI